MNPEPLNPYAEYQISNGEATKNTKPKVKTSLSKSERNDHQNQKEVLLTPASKCI